MYDDAIIMAISSGTDLRMVQKVGGDIYVKEDGPKY